MAMVNFSASTLNNTVNKGIFPRIILNLIEQGHTSTDAQIKMLLADVQYPENVYALKYTLEYNDDSVSEEVLKAAMKSLYPKELCEVYTEETLIKLEWRLRTIMVIL